jgi:hypothetical protein
MKQITIVLACMASACASTYAPNPADPVDMAAALGDRGRAYVGMGEACDAVASGGHRDAIVQTVELQQQRLGVLAGLVNRAYRGHASEDLIGHMHAQMSTHGLTAEQFCSEVVAQADEELSQRAAYILTLSPQPDIMYYVRDVQGL